MIGFILARAVRAIIVLVFTVTVVFIVLRLSGDPAQQMLSDNASPEALAAFNAKWALDRSIFEQYLFYVANYLNYLRRKLNKATASRAGRAAGVPSGVPLR